MRASNHVKCFSHRKKGVIKLRLMTITIAQLLCFSQLSSQPNQIPFLAEVDAYPISLNVSNFDTLFKVVLTVAPLTIDSLSEVIVKVGTSDTLVDIMDETFYLHGQNPNPIGTKLMYYNSNPAILLGRWFDYTLYYSVWIKTRAGTIYGPVVLDIR